MRRGIKQRFLAALIAAFMVVSGSGAVFAAEEILPVREAMDADEQAALSEEELLSENRAEVWDKKDEQERSQPSENQTPVMDAEDTVQAENASGSVEEEVFPEVPEEAASEEAVSEEAASEEAVSVNSADAVIMSMPEGFILSEKQIEGKRNIIGHDVLRVLDTLEAGKDYVEDEVIFSCDDPEYAKTVAEAYCGTLKYCESGLAVIKLDASRVTVKDAVKAGADMTNSLPPVDANTLIKIDDPVMSDGITLQDTEGLCGIMAAKGNSVGGRDWSFWRKQFNDPALDPAYTAVEPTVGIKLNMYQWMHDAIGSYAAWGASQGEGVTVAVIDTGVYDKHPDLRGKVTPVDGKAYAPHYEFVDCEGHGTHVAGIIAAAGNNAVGGVGVAPKARILSLPVFTGLQSPVDVQIAAINYVINGGKIRAEVINMSMGTPMYLQAYQDTINRAHEAGITVCASMGNSSTNNISYPAGCDNVIAVASMDPSWQKSNFSTYGGWADIAAPGTMIYSTWNGHDEHNYFTDYDYWTVMDGTSMACPAVAGVCALYISAKKAKGEKTTPDEVEKALKKTAIKASSPYKIGAGMANAANMLSLVENTQAPVINVPGTISEKSRITFSDNNAAGKTQGFVYTVNGKKPLIQGGEIREGFYVENTASPGTVSISVEELIDHGIHSDESVKLKVLRITGIGTASDVAECIIQIPGKSVTYHVEGPAFAARGRSVTYRLNPGFKQGKVVWTLEGAPEGVTINKQTGKVSIKKTAAGSFTVAAEAGGKRGTLAVKIVDPANSLTLKAGSLNPDINDPKTDKNGNLKNARVFNTDITASKNIIENQIILEGRADNGAELLFTSSKPSVAQVDASGKVTGRKAGTAKITCKASDGSNKVLVLTVSVVVPVSKLEIFPDGLQECVAYGKKIKLRPAMGSAYGTPTVKKVQWEILRVIGCKSKTDRTDLTSGMKSYFNLSNGNLSVNRNLENAGSYGYYDVIVRVKTTDGTGLFADTTVHVVPPTKKMIALNKKTVKMPVDSPSEGALFSGDLGWVYTVTSGGSLIPPEIISSNPAVVSVQISNYSLSDGGGLNYTCLLVPHKKGNATVTIKATDGSGKRASTSFRIQ